MPRKYRVGPNNIRSQKPSELTPYYPDRQADEAQFARYHDPIPHGYIPAGAFTVAGYDSRMVNSIEFQKSLLAGDGTGPPMPPGIVSPDTLPGDNFSVEWTVPAGRTAILRDWSIDVSWQTPGNTSGLIDPFGLPIFNFLVNFLINDTPINEFSSMYFPEIVFGPIGGETFIIIPEGQVLKMDCSHVPGWNGGFDGLINFDSAIVTLGGQLLLSTGENIGFEPVNQVPIPVDNKKTVIE